MWRKKGFFVKHLLFFSLITAAVLIVSGYLLAAMNHSELRHSTRLHRAVHGEVARWQVSSAPPGTARTRTQGE